MTAAICSYCNACIASTVFDCSWKQWTHHMAACAQQEYSGSTFMWGHGAMLEDERASSTFVGNATGWAHHCTTSLGQPHCDIGSMEADPLLDAQYGLLACSPAVGGAEAFSGHAAVTNDYHARQRTGEADAVSGC